MEPLAWVTKKIDDITNRGSGHTPSQKYSEYWNGDIKWISLADCNQLDKLFIFDSKKKISEEGLKHSSAVLHPKGSVILSRDAGVGKSAILGDDMAVSQHFIAWNCKSQNILHNIFLYYWLQWKKPIFERMAVGSTVKTIGLPYFKKLTITYPPLKYQIVIANILRLWDTAIQKMELLIEKKQKIKKALMQQLLTGSLKVTSCYLTRWDEVKLKELCLIKKGNQLNKTQFVVNGLYPVLNGGILLSGYTNQWNTEKNTITISEGGNSCGFVNFNKKRFWCGGHCYALLNVKIDNDFLYHALKGCENLIMALRVGSGLPNIQKNDLDNFKIKIPTKLKDQQSIASVFANMDKEIQILKDQLIKLNNQKRGLMQQLLSGRMTIK